MTATTTKPFITDDYTDFPVGVRFGRASRINQERHDSDLGVWVLRENGEYDYAHDAEPRRSTFYADGSEIGMFAPFIALDPMPTGLERGDLVKITGPLQTVHNLGGEFDNVYFTEEDGDVFKVITPKDDEGDALVESVKTDMMQWIAATSLTKVEEVVEPEPATARFNFGDRVRVTGPLQTHTGEEVYGYSVGDEATVTNTDSTSTTYGEGSVRIENDDHYGQWIDPASLEKVTDEHKFEAGDRIRIVNTGVDLDGELATIADPVGHGCYFRAVLDHPTPFFGDENDPALLTEGEMEKLPVFELPEEAPKNYILTDKDGDFWKYNEVQARWDHSFTGEPGSFSFLLYSDEFAPYKVHAILPEIEEKAVDTAEVELIEPAKRELRNFAVWGEVPEGLIVKSIESGNYLLKMGGNVYFNAGCNPVTSGYIQIDNPEFYAPFAELERIHL